MEKLEASFTILIMSIGSSALMAMGLTPDPQSGQTAVDKDMARFNIVLLSLVKEKTKNNLDQEEKNFLDQVLADLQSKFLQLK